MDLVFVFVFVFVSVFVFVFVFVFDLVYLTPYLPMAYTKIFQRCKNIIKMP